MILIFAAVSAQIRGEKINKNTPKTRSCLKGDPGNAPELPHTQLRALLSHPGALLLKTRFWPFSAVLWCLVSFLPLLTLPRKHLPVFWLFLQNLPLRFQVEFQAVPLSQALQLQPHRALQHSPSTPGWLLVTNLTLRISSPPNSRGRSSPWNICRTLITAPSHHSWSSSHHSLGSS